MRENKLATYRAWILGFALCCVLLWRALSVWHVHLQNQDYQHCELCLVVAAQPSFAAPPDAKISVIESSFGVLCTLSFVGYAIFSSRQSYRANPAQAPPSR